MSLYNVPKEHIVQKAIDYFQNEFALYDLSPFYQVYLSDNIPEDYKQFVNKDTKTLSNAGGVTILPSEPNCEIIILLSSQNDVDEIIFATMHELLHMMDFLYFAKKYCNSKIHLVKNHKYCQTMIDWSEFHVKFYDNLYTTIFIDSLEDISKEESFANFVKNIPNTYYPTYTKKFLDKSVVTRLDILWYFGEIAMCNLYDKNNKYELHDIICEKYGLNLGMLYYTLQEAQTYKNCYDHLEENMEYIHKSFQEMLH